MRTSSSWSASLTTVILLMLKFIGSAIGFEPVISLDFSSKDNGGMCKTWVDPRGYSCKEHLVVTQDGYILSLQEISSKTNREPSNLPPVLLQHGLMVDGVLWLLLTPNYSLPFILVDNGYPVWIVNNRGTRYSRSHTSLTADDAAYWDWSWDELAMYDVQATLHYVHNQTGQDMHYVGHSQGTLVALAGFTKGLFTNMLRSAVLLSPIAYMSHVTAVLSKAASYVFMAELNKWMGLPEFDPNSSDFMGVFLRDVCQIAGFACSDMLTGTTGKNCCLNSSTIVSFFHHGLQSSATKNYIHQSQMVRGGGFRMYDYFSEEENMKHYGQSTPPVYNVSRIPRKFPLFISYGGADGLADVEDVQLLLHDLRNHRGNKLVVWFVDEFAHMDFIMSETAKEAVYDPVIAFLRQH